MSNTDTETESEYVDVIPKVHPQLAPEKHDGTPNIGEIPKKSLDKSKGLWTSLQANRNIIIGIVIVIIIIAVVAYYIYHKPKPWD